MSAGSDAALKRGLALAMATAQRCDEAASAWAAYDTAQKLYLAQPLEGPISQPRYAHLRQRLAEAYASAVNAFTEADKALRHGLDRHDDAAAPADAESIARVLSARHALDVADPYFEQFMLHMAGTGRLEEIDSHGVDWLLRFFAGLGFDARQEALPDRPPEAASALQIELLSGLWTKWSGHQVGGRDAGLAEWLSEHYGVSAPRFLRAGPCWHAINDLRNLVSQMPDEHEADASPVADSSDE